VKPWVGSLTNIFLHDIQVLLFEFETTDKDKKGIDTNCTAASYTKYKRNK